jgi:hypothetical protein
MKNPARIASTLIWHPVALAGWTYLILYFQHGAGSPGWSKRSVLLVTVGGVVVIGLLVFGASNRNGPHGLIDLARWFRARRRVERTHQGACVRCGYVLRGLTSKALCPECGLPTEIVETNLPSIVTLRLPALTTLDEPRRIEELVRHKVEHAGVGVWVGHELDAKSRTYIVRFRGLERNCHH